MKLKLKDLASAEVRVYLQLDGEDVAIRAEHDGDDWLLLKLTPRGLRLASDVPEELGFPLCEKDQTIQILKETA